MLCTYISIIWIIIYKFKGRLRVAQTFITPNCRVWIILGHFGLFALSLFYTRVCFKKTTTSKQSSFKMLKPKQRFKSASAVKSVEHSLPISPHTGDVVRASCVASQGSCCRLHQCLFCVPFCVQDYENCMVWCLALLCGRMCERKCSPERPQTSNLSPGPFDLGCACTSEWPPIRLSVFRPGRL